MIVTDQKWKGVKVVSGNYPVTCYELIPIYVYKCSNDASKVLGQSVEQILKLNFDFLSCKYVA